MRHRVGGPLLDGGAVRSNGAVEIAEVVVNPAQIAVRFGNLRVGGDGGAQGRSRRIKVAQLVQCTTELVMRFGELVAVLRDHFLAGLDDAVQVAVIIKRACQIQIRIWEDRLLGDGAAQLADRIVELADLVISDAEPVVRPR